MKELSFERMERVKGGKCTFASDMAVLAATTAAGAIIGIASFGMGTFLVVGVSAAYSYGCHNIV
ncbi:hypothetical protein [Echinicola salinicaeni]|uniref:hypothetical protein n=1 Tax=Echinicola salinicaeni TaxID=2762757 RepID=UPI0016449F79|nr:hypothetical protein [Echinicola salinicaeni]